MARESTVVTAIRKLFRRRGVWSLKVHGDEFTPMGTPDLLACVHGRFLALEVKRPDGGIRGPLQEITLAEIRAAGGVAEFVTSAAEVQDILDRMESLMPAGMESWCLQPLVDQAHADVVAQLKILHKDEVIDLVGEIGMGSILSYDEKERLVFGITSDYQWIALGAVLKAAAETKTSGQEEEEIL